MPYVGSYIWNIRQKIGHDPLLMPSADAIAVDKDGRLLLVFNKDWQDWFFPGGYAEPGQSSQECSARELLEEAGVRADPEKLLPIAFVSGHKAQYPNGDVTHPFTQIFIAYDWVDEASELDMDEVEGRKWFTIDELKGLGVKDYTRQIIDAYEAFLRTRQYQTIHLRDEQ